MRETDPLKKKDFFSWITIGLSTLALVWAIVSFAGPFFATSKALSTHAEENVRSFQQAEDRNKERDQLMIHRLDRMENKLDRLIEQGN